jgi:hypothetical protein
MEYSQQYHGLEVQVPLDPGDGTSIRLIFYISIKSFHV